MRDTVVPCRRCKSDACYEQHIDTDITTWLCLGCGFTTSTLMHKGSKTKVVEDALKSSPELYRDLVFEDREGYFWLPATITLPERGMVFVDGTDRKNWRWAAAKAVKRPKNKMLKLVSTKSQEWMMDMKNVKYYKSNDFMDALEEIGFFEQ